jgi:hypothetical protein
MSKIIRDLTTLTFDGPKYEDHGLEIDDLSELQQYKHILVDTARDVWMRKNPDRERIPKGWQQAITIKMYGIEPGSAAVTLKREIESEDAQMQIHTPDEFDEAAEILQDSIAAAADDKPLPETLPKNVIPLFEHFGDALGQTNRLRIRTSGREHEVVYTQQVQKRLAQWLEKTYLDHVDVTGEVRATDLDGGRFTLRLEDGGKVIGTFTPEQETLVTDALKDHQTQRLHVVGRGEYRHDTAKLDRITEVSDLSLIPLGEPQFDESAQPIWEEIATISSGVPGEAWDSVPEDLASNLDHYLYGSRGDGE